MITNGPKNVIVCIGAETEMSCEVNSSSIIKPKWRIIKRNDIGDIISNETFSEYDIRNDHSDGLQWKESLNNDNHMFSLSVGPVNETYNNTSYQCIFTSITSAVGTITVIGMYVHIYVCTHVRIYVCMYVHK